MFPCLASAYQVEISASHDVSDFDDDRDLSSNTIFINYFTRNIEVNNRLNTRPRKCLEWQTPHQALKAAAKKHGVALRT